MFTLLERIVGGGGVGGYIKFSCQSLGCLSTPESERKRESLLCFYAYACLRVSLRILLVSALSLSHTLH